MRSLTQNQRTSPRLPQHQRPHRPHPLPHLQPKPKLPKLRPQLQPHPLPQPQHRKLQPQAHRAHPRPLSQPPVPRQVRLRAFLVRATILSLRHREWAFLAQSRVRATTHSHHLRAWGVQVKAVRLVPVVPRVQVEPVEPAALRVPVVQVVQVAQAVPVVRLAQVMQAHAQVLVAEPQPAEPQVSAAVLAHLVQAVGREPAVAAVLVEEPPVPSVRVARVVRPRHASRSARNAKSTNKEPRRA